MEADARGRLIRVVLTGSESTGKTMLAQQLAAHFGVEWVPEFVRGYAVSKGGIITFEDHGPIAHGQMALDDEFRSRAHGLLFHDTDLVSTAVYCDHYFGTCPPWITDEARTRRADLYLLMDIDVPWVSDPARDRGHRREEMHALFVNALDRFGAPYVRISGDWATRFEIARNHVTTLIGSTRRQATSGGS